MFSAASFFSVKLRIIRGSSLYPTSPYWFFVLMKYSLLLEIIYVSLLGQFFLFLISIVNRICSAFYKKIYYIQIVLFSPDCQPFGSTLSWNLSLRVLNIGINQDHGWTPSLGEQSSGARDGDCGDKLLVCVLQINKHDRTR